MTTKTMRMLMMETTIMTMIMILIMIIVMMIMIKAMVTEMIGCSCSRSRSIGAIWTRKLKFETIQNTAILLIDVFVFLFLDGLALRGRRINHTNKQMTEADIITTKLKPQQIQNKSYILIL